MHVSTAPLVLVAILLVGFATCATHTISWKFDTTHASRKIALGDTVLWLFGADNTAHSIVNDDDIFGIGSTTTGTYSFDFTAVGLYDYHCGIHSSMQAAILVVDGKSSVFHRAWFLFFRASD